MGQKTILAALGFFACSAAVAAEPALSSLEQAEQATQAAAKSAALETTSHLASVPIDKTSALGQPSAVGGDSRNAAPLTLAQPAKLAPTADKSIDRPAASRQDFSEPKQPLGARIKDAFFDLLPKGIFLGCTAAGVMLGLMSGGIAGAVVGGLAGALVGALAGFAAGLIIEIDRHGFGLF
jgi:hypothetical protein